MMIHFAIMNPDGTVHSLGANKLLPDGAIRVTGDLSSYATQMFIDGAWQQRPLIAAPVVVGNIVQISDVPDGTECTVIDRDYNAVLGSEIAVDGVIEFEIAQAGTYQLDIKAPLPWVSKTINVVIA